MNHPRRTHEDLIRSDAAMSGIHPPSDLTSAFNFAVLKSLMLSRICSDALIITSAAAGALMQIMLFQAVQKIEMRSV